jgi:hypothetical protein
MAKANKTAVAQATAPVFPTAEQMHATTQAILNAPPKGINWDSFDNEEMTKTFALQKEADDSIRALAGRMFVAGFTFAKFNNEKGELDSKAAAVVELRKRLANRLSARQQALVSMDRWNAATHTADEKDDRIRANNRLDKMVSRLRTAIKKEEGIEVSRTTKTLEEKIYADLTKIRETIAAADPDKVKFSITDALADLDTLRDHFNI